MIFRTSGKGGIKLKPKYYSLKQIKQKGARYNVIFGERSNGKSYSVLNEGVEHYAKTGKQMAIIRRWDEDFKGKRASQMFDALVSNGEVKRYTDNEWTDIYYYAGKWYFCRFDESGKRETKDEPFAFAFSLSAMEHDKSTSYPNVDLILFDEFLSRSMYIPDEFMLFMNTLSTIIRHRNDVIIYMLGNTVTKYCPYFHEMGLTHIKDMKPGDIDVYEYGDSGLRVAVEYCSPNKSGKESDVYFAFNNPKLKMITGGSWELDVYPHCPIKYKPSDILFTYFIEFDGDMLQCEIVQVDESTFTFIHRKTTPLKNVDSDLIFTSEYSPKPNYRRRINKPRTDIERKISEFFITDKVFYQDNETGEIVRNYLQWCGKPMS